MVLFPPGQRVPWVPSKKLDMDAGNTAVSGRYFTKIGLDAVGLEAVHRSISADEKDEIKDGFRAPGLPLKITIPFCTSTCFNQQGMFNAKPNICELVNPK